MKTNEREDGGSSATLVMTLLGQSFTAKFTLTLVLFRTPVEKGRQRRYRQNTRRLVSTSSCIIILHIARLLLMMVGVMP